MRASCARCLGSYRNTEQVKPVNVNTIIEDTLLLLNRQLQRANVEVQTQLDVLPDAVIAADQIRQVLSNLVINARDAMPNGGKLRIRSRHIPGYDDLHGWVRILIADTGSGIPPEMIRTIFEPFVTTKGERGTGLGLWIVKGIIQNHAGKLSVRSRMGRGTTFKIDLPVENCECRPKNRVPVVDDEAAVLLYRSVLSERQGDEVVACGTSRRRLRRWRRAVRMLFYGIFIGRAAHGFEEISAARKIISTIPGPADRVRDKETADEAASRGIGA